MDPFRGLFWSFILFIASEFHLPLVYCLPETFDSSTEVSCKPFFCDFNIPLPCQHRCDGEVDCIHGEDEKDCPVEQGGLFLNVTPEHVVVKQGETIQVNCSTKEIETEIIDLKWQAIGSDIHNGMFKQVHFGKYVIGLMIQKAQPENSGTYRCKLHTADGQYTSKLLQIWVNRTASLRLNISPNKVVANSLSVFKGETIQVNCTARDLQVPVTDLKWEAKSGDTLWNVRQIPHDKSTVSLHIANAQPKNSGTYTCKLFTSFGETTNIQLYIQVKEKISINKAVANTQRFCNFYCKHNIRISCHYRCDGQVDCPFGEDEKDCSEMICEGKFRCNNSRCIDQAYVCDAVNHCDDWSDEHKCMMVTTELAPVDSTEDNQMVWLKTTVYTVIACTVGIVFLISVIVIAIFRIKMKRAAVRRALRQAGRRQRHSNRCDSQNNSGTQRTEPVEREPFISAPSPTHFGNIIVNVNNGVQYVPNVEFPPGVQAPPPYSEVMAESGLVGRHSPPPEYSTIDRNPNRISQMPDSELQIQLICEGRSAENNGSHIASGSNESENYNCDVRDMQHSESFNDNNSVTNCTDNAITTTPPPCSAHPVNRDGTNSLGRRQNSSQNGRQSRNVRSVGSPRRPKQLKVCDGQIVLDGDSSNSSSPETVNRNTQTNPADISSANQNVAKPAQIQVQAGQIILANQEAESSVSASEADGAIAQGQLDVKDGHIVFKPSGS